MRRLRFWLLAAALGFATTPAYPEFPEGVPDPFRLRLGAFFADLETEVGAGRLGAPLGGLDSAMKTTSIWMTPIRLFESTGPGG